MKYLKPLGRAFMALCLGSASVCVYAVPVNLQTDFFSCTDLAFLCDSTSVEFFDGGTTARLNEDPFGFTFIENDPIFQFDSAVFTVMSNHVIQFNYEFEGSGDDQFFVSLEDVSGVFEELVVDVNNVASGMLSFDLNNFTQGEVLRMVFGLDDLAFDPNDPDSRVTISNLEKIAVAIPEPSTFGLLFIGLIGLSLRLKWKWKHPLPADSYIEIDALK